MNGFPEQLRFAVSYLAELPSRTIDLCYPRDCAACGEPAGETYRWLCEECAAKLPVTAADNCCALCGAPFAGVVTTKTRVCAECAALNPHWSAGKTLLKFDGPAIALVHALKYGGAKQMLEDVRTLLIRRPDIIDMLRGAALVPVPLYHARRRERGYNQSEWLARLFAREAGCGVRDLLIRTRDTGTQTLLSMDERRKNVRGAFAPRPNATIRPGRKYVLVDDVITTGSTLEACAAALVKAGADEPAVLTLAHA
jgi:ComF family protein